MGTVKLSYTQSLRFKLMLLTAVPLILSALIFIGQGVLIAWKVRDLTIELAAQTATQAGAESQVAEAIKSIQPDLGWMTVQWTIFFFAMFVIFFIPITTNIKKIICPLRQMAFYANSLAEGHVDITVEKTRIDEMGILQDSFHRLVEASRLQARKHSKDGGRGYLGAVYPPFSR